MLNDPVATLPPDSPAAASLAHGRELRKHVPRRATAAWTAPADRVDPVDTVIASNEGRLPDLVPIRIGRMIESPFTFYRGSAAVMAGDLASTPSMGSTVQLCGDAHLSNFGVFGSPERRLVFDLQRLRRDPPGPLGMGRQASRRELRRRLAGQRVQRSRPRATWRPLSAAQYRTWIRRYAGMRALEVWYAAIPIEEILAAGRAGAAACGARDDPGGGPGDRAPQGSHGRAGQALGTAPRTGAG